LADLCKSTGSICAALVDQEGETVDYTGFGDPFEIRILAAELRLLLTHLSHAPRLASTIELTIVAKRKSYFVRALPDGYALIVQLARRASGISPRPLALAVVQLCKEAGFAVPSLRQGRASPESEAPWRRVEVEEDAPWSRRPRALRTSDGQADVEVIGRLAVDPAARRGERGYRVRLSNGEEGTLVREPLGFWYLEEDP